VPVTNYYTVEGQIIGEETSGVRTDYLTDALGSVTATVDQNPAIVNTYRYKPYGGLLAKTGAGADPKFTWVGSHGYRHTGRTYSYKYVRARHYGSSSASWTSFDKLWPVQLPYSAFGCSPSNLIDSSGMASYDIKCGDPTDKRRVEDSIRLLCNPTSAGRPSERIDCCLESEICGPLGRHAPYHPTAFQSFCAGKIYVEFQCAGRFASGDCEEHNSRDCAYTNLPPVDKEIVICGSSLTSKSSSNPQPGCEHIHCVVWHEMMHWFSYSHTKHPLRTAGDNAAQCCCFNCIRHGDSICDGYFAFGHGRTAHTRYTSTQCEAAFGEPCP
jgi:hypothetical protein